MSPLASLFPSGAVWSGDGDDMIALHGVDGRFSRVSASALQVVGQEARALIGRRLTDIVRPEDHPRALAALAAVAETGTGRFEAQVPLPDGEAVPIEVVVSQTAQGFRSVARRCDARAVRDAAMKAESADVAWSADRRTEHLVNVSHEIRTPLGAVIGFADALQSEAIGPGDAAKVREYAKIIHDSGQHLLSLVTDLLDLSKAEANALSVEPRPVDLVGEIRMCADIVRLQAEKAGLSIEVEAGPALPRLMLDAKIVRQIVLNLLSNALKFTAEGGLTVKIAARRDAVTVTVRDTGVGMSPGDLAKIGQRFVQARKEGVRGTRGTGIGLSLSQALARVHGGDLRLASSVGSGTTAVLSLPYDPAPQVAGEAAESNVHPFRPRAFTG